MPDASLPSSVMHYPTRLMAPDAFDTAAEHPIGTGPFKFVSWTRNNEARMVRFENYWETDAEGHSLPYLDEIIGKPKLENSVRLTALRTLKSEARRSSNSSVVSCWRLPRRRTILRRIQSCSN